MDNGITISHANVYESRQASCNVVLSKDEYEDLLECREKARLFVDLITESFDFSCKDNKLKVDENAVITALRVCYSARFKDFARQQKKKEAQK